LSKHLNFNIGQPFFFSNFGFSPKCAPFLLKIEEDSTLMIRKAKRFKLMRIAFITDLITFNSKMLLTLKIMDFENVPSTKVVQVYVIKSTNA
jgi:hypothetical protein